MLQIDSPVHGIFTQSTSIGVTGHVLNPVAGEVVSVNGVMVTVQPDNSFSTTITLSTSAIFNPILAELSVAATGYVTRARVVVISGAAIADGSYSPHSIALRLNDSGFNAVEPVLPTLVSLDLNALIPPGTRLISNYCAIPGPFGTCLNSVDVDSESASIDSFGINVDSMLGFVAGDMTLNRVVVVARIHGGIFDCHLEVTASQAFVLGDYGLIPLAADPNQVDVNQIGNVSVSFTNFNNRFVNGGVCDFPLIGALIDLIVGDLEPTIRDALIDYLKDPDGSGPQDSPIAGALQAALGGIEIAGPIGQAIGVNLETPLFMIAEDLNGVTFGSDARITASNPAPGAPNLAASYHVSQAFPSLGTTTPVNHLPYDVARCISASAFNQLLKADVESGLMASDVTQIDLGAGAIPLTAGVLASIIPEFGSLDPALPMKIRLRPTLAPIVTGNAGPSGELAELKISHLLADVVSGPPGGETVYLGVAIDLRTGFGASFNNLTGQLDFVISPPLSGDISVVILNNAIGTDEGSLLGILPPLFAPVFPTLANSLGSFPIPSFLGLTSSGVEVSRAGQFMSVFLDLL
jgi:hypothetical protein